MKNGTRVIKRSSARNYSYISAQKRLDETVVPYNQQVLNSLAVDNVPIYYYNALHIGLPCSCEQQDSVIAYEDEKDDGLTTSLTQTHSSRNLVIGKQGGSTFSDFDGVEIIDADSINSFFGESSMIETTDDYDLIDDGGDYAPVEEIVENYSGESSIYAGHNVNCGLCYRTGFVPSHSLQRGIRIVLTHHNVVEAVGYFVNNAEFPFRFERLNDDGLIEFALTVPKYYVKALFSIRNNHAILNDSIYYNGDVLTETILRNNAGKTLAVQINSKAFTHVTIEFLTNAEMIQSNWAAINKTLDYTLLETIGNLQVILPMTIGSVGAGDLIAAPSRNLYVKVVDIEHSTTATMRRLGWSASCRVLQPTETLRKLFFNRTFNL